MGKCFIIEKEKEKTENIWSKWNQTRLGQHISELPKAIKEGTLPPINCTLPFVSMYLRLSLWYLNGLQIIKKTSKTK